MFTKIVTCKRCGSPLVLHRQVARGKNYGYLICSGSRNNAGDCGMKSIRYDKFEASMLEIISAVDCIRSQMQEKSGPNQVDILTAKLRELEAEGEKFMRYIDGELNPPKRLLGRLSAVEAEETEVREKLEIEKARVTTMDTGMTWGHFRKILPEKLSDTDFRLRLKTAARSVIETVIVDLAAKKFELRLKGYASVIDVELKGDNLFYVIATGKDKAMGCCCPISARWKAA